MKVKSISYLTAFTKDKSEGIAYISELPLQLPYIGDFVTVHDDNDKTLSGEVSEIKRAFSVQEKGKLVINVNVVLKSKI